MGSGYKKEESRFPLEMSNKLYFNKSIIQISYSKRFVQNIKSHKIYYFKAAVQRVLYLDFVLKKVLPRTLVGPATTPATTSISMTKGATIATMAATTATSTGSTTHAGRG